MKARVQGVGLRVQKVQGVGLVQNPFCRKMPLGILNFHARVLEGVNSFKSLSGHALWLSTFENSCLGGEMTFGDPFEDSGVVVALPLELTDYS